MSGNGKEKKMKQIVLVAETGSDINPVLAAEYNIKIVPMHVSFDHETMEDGAFPVEKIVDYYEETGRLPKTSGSTPGDFETAFDRIHAEYPDAQLLYLAYSAVTTCSMQSAVLAAEERDYVTILDTKQVSAGQCNVVIAVAELLQQHPDWTMAEAVRAAEDLIARARMCFMPENLEFLRAGGRVSNVAFLGAKLLNLHPVIEILDGKLVATKKYRGKMKKVAVQMVTEYAEKYNLERDCLWFVWIVGFSECGAAGGGGSGEGAWLQENQMDSGGRRDYHAWRPSGVWLGRVYEEISRNRAIKVKKV